MNLARESERMQSFRAVLLGAVVFPWSVSGIAAEIHVPSDYSSIGAALRASAPGDVIVVAPGDYAEFIVFPGHDVTVVSSHGAESTVLDPTHLHSRHDLESVVRFERGETRATVLEGFTIVGGRGSAIDLADPDQRFGGGVLVRLGSSPTLRNNVVRGNRVDHGTKGGRGGGVFVADGCAPLLIGNRVCENFCDGFYGGLGGGLAAVGAELDLVANVFEHNLARAGGGIYALDSSGSWRDNLLCDNRTDWGGGGAGAWIEGTECPELVGNDFLRNHAHDDEIVIGKARGGGLYYAGSAVLDVHRGVFAENECFGPGGGMHASGPEIRLADVRFLRNHSRHPFSSEGGGAWLDGAAGFVEHVSVLDNLVTNQNGAARSAGLFLQSPVPVDSSVFWQNQVNGVAAPLHGPASVRYSVVEGGWKGKGNIDQDPRLNAEALPFADSPCIDCGNPQHVATRQAAEGAPRRLDGNLDGELRVDMGAVEFTHLRLSIEEPRSPATKKEVGTVPDLWTLIAEGTAGTYGLLWLATDEAVLPHARWGALYVDVTQSRWMPLGRLPTTRSFPAPPPALEPLFVQGVAVLPSTPWGTASNVLVLAGD